MNGSSDDDLTRHARTLKGLARALVGVEHADDVVQDATVEALRQPPKQGISLFAWLAGVVRNRARRHHRDTKRRSAREQRAAAAAPLQESSTPLDAAVHREMVARLDAALLGLPQPYQDTLLWRYYEGLSPGEIAARSGTPVATVKSRLQRGLAMMRERLDEDRRGGDWRKALGAVFGAGEQSATAAAAAIAGITWMLGKLALGALAAVLVGVYLWQSFESPDLALTAAASNGAATTAEASGPGTALVDVIAQREAAPKPTTARPAVGSATGEATIAGRCVDEAGNPLAGVRIEGRIYRSGSGSERYAHTVESGGDGTFAISFPISADENLGLSLQSPEHCEATGTFRDILAGERRDLGDLVMSLAYRVRGRVVDSKGVPQPDVAAIMNLQGPVIGQPIVRTWSPTSSGARTDALGEFVLTEKFPSGSYWIEFKNRALMDRNTARFELGGESRERTLEFVVAPAPLACRGIVVRSDGSPIPNALVSLDDNYVRTDPGGKFTVLPNPTRHPDQRFVAVQADGYLRRTDFAWRTDDPSEQRIELTPAPALILRVLDGATGHPIQRYAAHIVAHNNWHHHQIDTIADHPAGVSRQLVDPGHWFVTVKPGEGSYVRTAFIPFEMPTDRDIELTVYAWPEQTRRLVVTDGERRIAGVDVVLLDPGNIKVRRDTETWTFEDCKVSGPPLARIVHKGTTDADGTLLLRGPKADLALRLSGGDIALQIVQPIRLDETTDLVVPAQRGTRLRGRLIPLEVAQYIYSASKVGANEKPVPVGIHLIRVGDDHESLHRHLEPPFAIDEDGAFDIRGLPAGHWHVVVRRGKCSHAVTTVDVPAGGELQRDIDVTSVAPALVTLRFLVDGTPAKNAYINAMGWHSNNSFGRPQTSQTIGRTDEHGIMRIETLAGQLVLHVSAVDASGSGVHLVTTLPVPRTGQQEHVLDLRIGSLDLTIMQPDGSPAAGVRIRMAGSHDSWNIISDASGRVTCKHMAAGLLALEALPRSLGSEEARNAHARAHGYQALEHAWVSIGSITIAPGGAAPQRLTLPAHWDR